MNKTQTTELIMDIISLIHKVRIMINKNSNKGGKK